MTIDFNDLERPKNLKLTCVVCKYDVSGIAENAPCPECGNTVVYSEASINQSTKKAAVGMILGVASLLSCFGCGYGSILGLPIAIAGFLVCESAHRDIKLNKAHPSSISYVRIGKVCNIFGVIINLIILIYVMSFIINGPLITA